MITEEFMSIIDQDIDLIKENEGREENDGKQPSFFTLYIRILSKYKSIIDGFGDEMITNHAVWAYKRNLITLKEKLQIFKAMNYENVVFGNQSDKINVSVYNTNQVDVRISFEQVRNSIKNSKLNLPPDEINEILEKIDVIEKIIKSQKDKKDKWEQLKGILKWIADKSVDVGIAILPLLTELEKVN